MKIKVMFRAFDKPFEEIFEDKTEEEIISILKKRCNTVVIISITELV